MKTYHLLILLMTASFCLQCKKDDQETDSLTINKWKRGITDKNVSSNPPGRILYNAILDCDKDDELKFNADGTLIINYGADKCHLDQPETDSLTYVYNRASKEFVIDAVKFTLAEETENQIKYFAPLPSTSGYDYVVYLLVRP